MALLLAALYGLAFLGAIVYVVASASARGLANISIPQMLYVMYVLLTITVLGITRNIFAMGVGYAIILFMFLKSNLKLYDRWEVRKRALENELRDFRNAAKAVKKNSPAFEMIGDRYAAVADAPLAKKYYETAHNLIPGPALAEKLADLAKSPPVFRIDGDDLSAGLRACPGCESIAFRMQRACPRCKHYFFPDPARWNVLQLNRSLDSYGITRMTAAAVLFLPFLFQFGPLAYGLLLTIWTLALWSQRDESDERPPKPHLDELKGLTGRSALVVVLALGVLEYGHRENTGPAKSGPSPESPRARAPGLSDDPDAADSMDSRMAAAMEAGAPLINKALAARDQANKRHAQNLREMSQATGHDLVNENPLQVAQEAIAMLRSENLESKRQAAMTLCDNRFAKHALEALPLLEDAKALGDSDLKGMAELAIRRIRFMNRKALRQGFPRTTP